jgi:hypothetical protein
MHVDLDLGDISVILQSLEYSLLKVNSDRDSLREVRRENISRIETAKAKLIDAKRNAE